MADKHSDYDRTKTLRRAFELMALLRQCPRTLAFLAEQIGVGERTVRRDLYTLEQAGIALTTTKVPITAERRGHCGNTLIRWTTVWRVMAGAPCPICARRSSSGVTWNSPPPVGMSESR